MIQIIIINMFLKDNYNLFNIKVEESKYNDIS